MLIRKTKYKRVIKQHQKEIDLLRNEREIFQNQIDDLQAINHINGAALHSLVRIFNHDLDKVIEKLKNPVNVNEFDLKDSDSVKINELGHKLCSNSDWKGIRKGKEEEFSNDLKELKDLFLNMSKVV